MQPQIGAAFLWYNLRVKTGGYIKRHQPLRQYSFTRSTQTPQVKAALRRLSDSPTAVIKRNIQELLRELAIRRDGGCILRHYPEAGACGGYRQDGELIVQAEHLNSRINAVSYGDMRNIVLLCRHHHIDWKPQHSRTYWRLIHLHIGPVRSAWLDRVEADRSAHRFYVSDWKAIEISLRAELKKPQ